MERGGVGYTFPMRALLSLAACGLLGASVLVGCSSPKGTGASAHASQSAAPATVARRDLGSLVDFKTRWDAAVTRDGKVPKLGELEVSRAGSVDTFRAPPFDLGAAVTLSGTVDHATQRLLRVTLTIASKADDARQALSMATHPLLDAVDPNATSKQHNVAALSLPFSASGSADFHGGYTVALEPKASGGVELSIAPTTSERLEEIGRGTATPVR